VRKNRTGRELDGETHDAIPPRPPRSMPPLDERRRMIARLETGSTGHSNES
jgi:hypothetical protein